MKGISRSPEIMHGLAVLTGTRIPTEAIHELANAGYTYQQIVMQYPTLTRVQIDACVRYEKSIPRKVSRLLTALKMRLAVWALGFDIDDERG